MMMLRHVHALDSWLTVAVFSNQTHVVMIYIKKLLDKLLLFAHDHFPLDGKLISHFAPFPRIFALLALFEIDPGLVED